MDPPTVTIVLDSTIDDLVITDFPLKTIDDDDLIHGRDLQVIFDWFWLIMCHYLMEFHLNFFQGCDAMILSFKRRPILKFDHPLY